MLMRRGSDALIITTGITLRNALEAADRLTKQGIHVSVLHVPTIKPLDKEAILDCVKKTSTIVTIEEHTIIGGLGGAVTEIIAEANCMSPKNFKRIGIPDVFPVHYGSQASLMQEFLITTENLVSTINHFMKKDKDSGKLFEQELVRE